MQKILNGIMNITNNQILDIVFAICIVILFKIFSSTFSYYIVKLFKIKTKNKREIKESAFYQPLKLFIQILGIYIGICLVRTTFSIPAETMIIIKKIFKIISVIAFAKGLASSFMPKSTLAKKMKEKTGKDDKDTSFDFILKGIRFLIYVIATFIVMALLEINLSGLVAGVGIGGVIITLAAQDTAKNLFGGLVILFDKPFKVGDWIEMPPYEGTVEDVTFRSTRVRTFENSVVNIPNSVISNSSIINWSKMEKRRFKINVCIDSDTSFDKLDRFKIRVEKMLEEREAIYDDSIIVRFDEIKENGINILISSYTNSVDYSSYLAEKENANRMIMQILREENIEIAYDTKTVYVKK